MSERHPRNRTQGGHGHHRPTDSSDRQTYAPAGGASRFMGLNPKLPIVDGDSVSQTHKLSNWDFMLSKLSSNYRIQLSFQPETSWGFKFLTGYKQAKT